MVIVALFTIAKIRKQSKCPSMDEWNKKDMEYTHTHTHTHTHTQMEYHLTTKKNEILPSATTRMDLEGNKHKLSEISKKEKDSMFFLKCGLKIRLFF